MSKNRHLLDASVTPEQTLWTKRGFISGDTFVSLAVNDRMDIFHEEPAEI